MAMFLFATDCKNTVGFFMQKKEIMDKMNSNSANGMKLTEKEKKLLEMIRALKFGEMRIIIQDSEPVRVEEIKNSIKL